MSRIQIKSINSAQIETRLVSVNGDHVEHTFKASWQIEKEAKRAEVLLAQLGLTEQERAGVFFVSASAGTDERGSPKIVSHMTIYRDWKDWWIIRLKTGDSPPFDSVTERLILSREQDRILTNRLRSQYEVHDREVMKNPLQHFLKKA
jgi:hypothetical protein